MTIKFHVTAWAEDHDGNIVVQTTSASGISGSAGGAYTSAKEQLERQLVDAIAALDKPAPAAGGQQEESGPA